MPPVVSLGRSGPLPESCSDDCVSQLDCWLSESFLDSSHQLVAFVTMDDWFISRISRELGAAMSATNRSAKKRSLNLNAPSASWTRSGKPNTYTIHLTAPNNRFRNKREGY